MYFFVLKNIFIEREWLGPNNGRKQCKRWGKNRAINKRHTSNQDNVFMRYQWIPPPQIEYLIINIISITLITQLIIVKSSLLTHKGFPFNGKTPQMALIQKKHYNG